MSTTTRHARRIGYVNRKRPHCDECQKLPATTIHITFNSETHSYEVLAACRNHDWGSYWLYLIGEKGLLDGDALGLWSHLGEKIWRHALYLWLVKHDLLDLWGVKCEEQARANPADWRSKKWWGEDFSRYAGQ